MYIKQLLRQKMRIKQKPKKAKEHKQILHGLANVTYIHKQLERLYFFRRKQIQRVSKFYNE